MPSFKYHLAPIMVKLPSDNNPEIMVDNGSGFEEVVLR